MGNQCAEILEATLPLDGQVRLRCELEFGHGPIEPQSGTGLELYRHAATGPVSGKEILWERWQVGEGPVSALRVVGDEVPGAATGPCPRCGMVRVSGVVCDLPVVYQLPPEPAVGVIVEIVGGDHTGVRVVHRLQRPDGWQTYADPGGAFHSWPVVLAMAAQGTPDGSGTVRVVE